LTLWPIEVEDDYGSCFGAVDLEKAASSTDFLIIGFSSGCCDWAEKHQSVIDISSTTGMVVFFQGSFIVSVAHLGSIFSKPALSRRFEGLD
jgi:hypothetical protein